MSMNDYLAANYTAFAAFTLLIARHGIPHTLRLLRDGRQHDRVLVWLVFSIVMVAIGEGGVVGFFAGSRLWDRPPWMVWSDLPGLWRTLATIGFGVFYFALYGRTWGTLLCDGAIIAVFVIFFYCVWSI